MSPLKPAGDLQIWAVYLPQPPGDQGGCHPRSDQTPALGEERGGSALHSLPTQVLHTPSSPSGLYGPSFPQWLVYWPLRGRASRLGNVENHHLGLLPLSSPWKWGRVGGLVVVVCLCVLSRSVKSNSFATPQTVARKAPLSMEFPRQGYQGGLPCPVAGPYLPGQCSRIWGPAHQRHMGGSVIAHRWAGCLTSPLMPLCLWENPWDSLFPSLCLHLLHWDGVPASVRDRLLHSWTPHAQSCVRGLPPPWDLSPECLGLAKVSLGGPRQFWNWKCRTKSVPWNSLRIFLKKRELHIKGLKPISTRMFPSPFMCFIFTQ